MGWKPLLAIIFGILFLVACGSPPADAPETFAPESSTESSTESSSVSPAPTAPEKEPLVGGGRLVRLWADPPTLDPHLTVDSTSGGLVNEIYGGLVTLDLDLNVVPDLAESIQTSPDGRTYTFTLRENAKFHDGKTVTAQDVKWSLERATDPTTQSPVADTYLSDIVGVSEKLSSAATEISGVRVVDDRTIEITTDAPKSYFLAKLTYPTAFVLDRENVEGKGDDWLREPNGTGPFKLAQYDIGEVLRLQRHDEYHLGPAHLEEIEFILSGGTAMLMYENDEIHLTGVGLADLDRLLDPAEPLNAELQRLPASFSVGYIGMNVNEPPLDDPKFRQALNYAIDKPTIAEKALSNLSAPANGVIPPGFPSFNPDLRGYNYDPEKAKRLLQESKYADQLDDLPRITLNISGSFGADVPLDLEAILKSWEELLGVTVDIQQTEWATYLQDLHNKRYQMFLIGWSADYPDPENYLDLLFHSESENNQTNYNNPEVDRLLEEAREIPDQETRFRQYNRIEQMILDDAPWIPLWNRGERYALIKPEVKDYFLTPMTIPKYRHVYLEK
jgi:ABC-type transport system substrate-binding protein